MIFLFKVQVKDWENVFQVLADVLRSNDIFVKIYVKRSADGRLNMKGEYNGFAFWLKRTSYPSFWVHLFMCFRSADGYSGSFRNARYTI